MTMSHLDDLKQNIPLADFIRSQGYELKPRGNDYVLCCPFHEDKTLSCVITPSKNLYHCFGCGAAGSIIDWVMHTKQLELSRAIIWLQEYAGMKTKQDDHSSLAVSKVSEPPPGAIEPELSHLWSYAKRFLKFASLDTSSRLMRYSKHNDLKYYQKFYFAPFLHKPVVF